VRRKEPHQQKKKTRPRWGGQGKRKADPPEEASDSQGTKESRSEMREPRSSKESVMAERCLYGLLLSPTMTRTTQAGSNESETAKQRERAPWVCYESYLVFLWSLPYRGGRFRISLSEPYSILLRKESKEFPHFPYSTSVPSPVCAEFDVAMANTPSKDICYCDLPVPSSVCAEI
jgi:hypothetical protein